MNLKTCYINETRFRKNFDTLAKIGSTEAGGVHRPTFSDSHLQAREWFRQKILEYGFDFQVDGAGNHVARWECAHPESPTLIIGSHLDSVPNGGKFDGALGVVAALEVLSTIQDNNISLPFNLEAIDFTDEEGTLVSLLGSSAVAGTLTRNALAVSRGGRRKLLDGLARVDLTEEDLLQASRDPRTLAGYLELHIEQGSRLIDAGIDIGIVTGIVGIGSYRLIFVGREDHAGTTPMQSRLDAAQGASAFIMASRNIILEKYPDCTANVGQIYFEPGAFNIVPHRAVVSLEYRAPDVTTFDNIEAELLSIANLSAVRFGLSVESEFLGKHPPTLMGKEVQACIRRGAKSLGLTIFPMASGAGHDAQSLAKICPSGMIFVRSVDGASHSSREFTEWQDCVNGTNVLLQSVFHLSVTDKKNDN